MAYLSHHGWQDSQMSTAIGLKPTWPEADSHPLRSSR